MRQDAKALLERLERQSFGYRDFSDAAEEIELWPLFKVLLRDPRIVGDHDHVARELTAPADAAPAHAAEGVPAPSLFAGYRAANVVLDDQDSGTPQPGLRSFLNGLGKVA